MGKRPFSGISAIAKPATKKDQQKVQKHINKVKRKLIG
jgi:hypothetical protein